MLLIFMVINTINNGYKLTNFADSLKISQY